jgi:hypothetical protein
VRALRQVKSSQNGPFPKTCSGQFSTGWNTKSVQEVSKQLYAPTAHHGKTDIRYWQGAVYQPKYTRNGVVHQASEWAIKIQHLGRRETFPLGTANKADPLASHIFISRRQYRTANDTKSGKRRETNARLSFDTACELGFHGSLDEWERLMGAVAKR